MAEPKGRGRRLSEGGGGAHLPGCSGYLCLQYASSDAYTFSLSASTSAGLESPLESVEKNGVRSEPPNSLLATQAQQRVCTLHNRECVRYTTRYGCHADP